MGVNYAWEKFYDAARVLAIGGRTYSDRLAEALQTISVLDDFKDIPSERLREDCRSVFAEVHSFEPRDQREEIWMRSQGTLKLWVHYRLAAARRRELGEKIIDTFSAVAIRYPRLLLNHPV